LKIQVSSYKKNTGLLANLAKLVIGSAAAKIAKKYVFLAQSALMNVIYVWQNWQFRQIEKAVRCSHLSTISDYRQLVDLLKN